SADGTGAHRLTENGGTIDDWSADGRWIRFTRVYQWTGSRSIWEISAAGGGLRPFLPAWWTSRARWDEGQCCGQWTPDQHYFLFRESLDGRVALWATREKHSIPFRRTEATELYAAGF